jgi:hypothetical protein
VKDKLFLQWIRDRLIFVHHECKDMDYMHKLESVIEKIPDSQESPNIASIGKMQLLETTVKELSPAEGINWPFVQVRLEEGTFRADDKVRVTVERIQ